MPVHLNHTIIWSSDAARSADFLAEMFGRPTPVRYGIFNVVHLDNDVSLDFANLDGSVRSQHYAFLVDEIGFDDVMRRIRERRLPFWADPFRRRQGEINRGDGGRGAYFLDPDGHLLEIITRPYGSGDSQNYGKESA